MVMTIISPSLIKPKRTSSSSAACNSIEGSSEVKLNATGCTPLKSVTLLKVESVGVSAKIGTLAFMRDIHNAVEPD